MISNSYFDFMREFESQMSGFKETLARVERNEKADMKLAYAQTAQAQATVIAAMMEKVNP